MTLQQGGQVREGQVFPPQSAASTSDSPPRKWRSAVLCPWNSATEGCRQGERLCSTSAPSLLSLRHRHVRSKKERLQ
jgi:hypothetical protein